MKFGVREICDVVLRAKANQKIGNKIFYKDEPVLYFDTLKTSTMEGAATTVYAQGGRGNSRLVAWEGERTVTFTMEDALISPTGFAILSGAGLVEASENNKIKVHKTEVAEVSEVNEDDVKIELSGQPYGYFGSNILSINLKDNIYYFSCDSESIISISSSELLELTAYLKEENKVQLEELGKLNQLVSFSPIQDENGGITGISQNNKFLGIKKNKELYEFFTKVEPGEYQLYFTNADNDKVKPEITVAIHNNLSLKKQKTVRLEKNTSLDLDIENYSDIQISNKSDEIEIFGGSNVYKDDEWINEEDGDKSLLLNKKIPEGYCAELYAYRVNEGQVEYIKLQVVGDQQEDGSYQWNDIIAPNNATIGLIVQFTQYNIIIDPSQSQGKQFRLHMYGQTANRYQNQIRFCIKLVKKDLCNKTGYIEAKDSEGKSLGVFYKKESSQLPNNFEASMPITAEENNFINSYGVSRVFINNNSQDKIEISYYTDNYDGIIYFNDPSNVYAMFLQNGEINTEPYIPKDITDTGLILDKQRDDLQDIKVGDSFLVDYYTEFASGIQQIEITPDKFGGNYYLEASTLFRNQDGTDVPAEFIIPNCKIQSNFNFTMASSGDPSTFTFTMDAFPDYLRFDKSKRVLAAIQLINDEKSDSSITRDRTKSNTKLK